MKKLLLFFVLLVASVTMFGQPITPQVISGPAVSKDPPQMINGFLMFKSYAPSTSTPPIKYTKKRTQKYNTKPVSLNRPIGTKDTLVLYSNITLDYPVIEFLPDTTPKLNLGKYVDTTTLKFLIIPHIYRNRGVTKILSGIGLQAIAVGLIAYGNTNITSVMDVTETHELPYSYPVYELQNGTPIITSNTTTTTAPPTTTTTTSSTASSSTDITIVPGRGPWWRPRPTIIGVVSTDNTTNTTTTTTVNNTTNVNVTVTTPNPTLNMHMETGVAKFTETHQEVTVHERNKTPYYIAGGVMAAAGVALEVLGIIDFHKANVYVTNNSVGVVFKF